MPSACLRFVDHRYSLEVSRQRAFTDHHLPPNLVFAPHVYGPSVSDMGYFHDASFPGNLPAIWDAHFGYLRNSRALVIGEFGGTYDDATEVAWGDAFVDWLDDAPHGPYFFYWALNPNSGDTGGILGDDWQTPVARKLDLLAPLL